MRDISSGMRDSSSSSASTDVTCRRGRRAWQPARRSLARGATTLDPRASDHELVATLFDLGRQVTSVLALDELLARIPELMSRILSFNALAVYLLDEKRGELRIAYSVGYPEDAAASLRMKVGEGLVGASVAEQAALVVDDVTEDPRYVSVAPDMVSELVVPLLHQARVIGALNVLSATRGAFTQDDAAVVRQFAAHVAVALVNARMFERERRDADAFETLAEIGREMAAILDVDELFARMAQLVKRVIDFRTFGVFLLNAQSDLLEAKLAVQVRRSQGHAPRPDRRGPGRVRRAAQELGAGAGCERRHALHQGRRGRAIGAGRPDAAQGSLHRRARPREP